MGPHPVPDFRTRQSGTGTKKISGLVPHIFFVIGDRYPVIGKTVNEPEPAPEPGSTHGSTCSI